MLTSEDSFGWSDVSEVNMISSKDDDSSECSSVLDRKSQKKKLKLQISQSELNWDGNGVFHTEENISKKKKKKRVKVERTSDIENNYNNSTRDISNISMKSESDEMPRHKIKKIKTEPEETSESTLEKKSKKKIHLIPIDIKEHEVNQIKQEEIDGSSKKKKKKRKRSVELEVRDELPAGDILTISPAKKKRKKNADQSDATIIDYETYKHELSENVHESDTLYKSPKKRKQLSFSVPLEKSEDLSIEIEEHNSVTVAGTANRAKHENNSSGGHPDSIDSSTSRKVSTTSTASYKRHSSASLHDLRKRSTSTASSTDEIQASRLPDKNKINGCLEQTAVQKDSRLSFPLSKLENKKRASFSERIVFEDEPNNRNDSENEFNVSVKSSKASKKLEKFMQRNPKLKTISSAGLKGTISNRDKAWLIKCPKDFNHRKLKDMDISIEKKSKIKLNGQTFVGDLEEKPHRMAVLCPSMENNTFEIRDININGTLIFRKRIPKVPMNEMNVAVPKETFIPLPETKLRHPLFGHDYRKSMKIPKLVAERLDDTIPRKKLKSKHKHKDETQAETSVNEEPEVSFDKDNTSKKKKKRKRKHSEEADGGTCVKKLKHDPEWDSEQAIKSFLKF